MKELVERGHIYIAQPPLYKLKKGKQERYIKDDQDLNNYLMELALSEAELCIDKNENVSGDSIVLLGKDYLLLQGIRRRLGQRYEQDLLEVIRQRPALTAEELTNELFVSEWMGQLESQIQKLASGHYHIEKRAVDDPYFSYSVNYEKHGLVKEMILDSRFFSSLEYQKLITLCKNIELRLTKSSLVRRGEKSQPVDSVDKLFEWLFSEAKRGLHIQRYKGLGEMNPDQLWETTMNAETRNLLQVRIEDAIAADEIFTTLMGDQVEPRREFIEMNALNVTNLDT